MSESAEDKELNDIQLCYMALGASLGDSPEKLDRLYKNVTDGLKKEMLSPDPAVRTEARNSLNQVNEMYDKIRNSITYSSMARESQKSAERLAGQKSENSGSKMRVEKANLMNCPKCNNIISKTSKVCPICRASLTSGTEKFLGALFSIWGVIIMLSVVIAAAVITYLVSPTTFKGILESIGL